MVAELGTPMKGVGHVPRIRPPPSRAIPRASSIFDLLLASRVGVREACTVSQRVYGDHLIAGKSTL